MKKITLFSFMLTFTAGFSQVLPLDFESTDAYNFGNFAGTETIKVANPYPGGINTSANVAKSTRGPGEVYGGSYLDLANPMDLNTYHTFKVKIWSPLSGIDMKFKIESIPGTYYTEVDVINTVANGWEELTFDFPGIVSSHNYRRVVMILNYGVVGSGQEFYWDDVTLGPSLATQAFNAESLFKLYPNPATNLLNIQSKATIESIILYNSLGQQVMTTNPGVSIATLDVSSLQNGIYTVKTTANGQSSVSKFVKN